MNRPQVVYFLSGVLVYFPSGAPTSSQRVIGGDAVTSPYTHGSFLLSPHCRTD